MNLNSLKHLPWYFVTYRNPASVIVSILRNKDCKAVLRDGTEITVDPWTARAIPMFYYIYRRLPDLKNYRVRPTNFTEALLQLAGWVIDGQLLLYDSVKFLRLYNGVSAVALSLHEVFNEQIYFYRYTDSTVIDVGANIGDTAVYFARQGAKKVIGVEPIPNVYEIALHNVKLNNVNADIKNVAVCYGKNISVKSYVSPDVSGGYKAGDGDTTVDCVTLKDLGDADILKMDCEGCEWDVVKHGEYRNYQTIIVEVHGNFRKFIRMLSGYRVRSVRYRSKNSTVLILIKDGTK